MIEDRLTFDDGPSPSPVTPQPVTPIPTPIPYPVPAPTSTSTWKQRLQTYGPWVAVAILAGVLAWQMWKGKAPSPTPGPIPTPSVDAVTLGKNFVPKLAGALADGFETAATMIAAGTTVTDADSSLKTKFAAARNEAFKASVAPEFSKILPEGQEPKDAATREAFAKIHRDFASGLRGAK